MNRAEVAQELERLVAEAAAARARLVALADEIAAIQQALAGESEGAHSHSEQSAPTA